MKYIKKNLEPPSFSKWKGLENDDWKPSWNNFQKPEKTDVHNELLKEQGYICCYCGVRITREVSHIEHFKPRKTYPNLALEYSNFLASCPGEGDEPDWENPQKIPPAQKHCGQKKGYWYDENLTVSPLLENCAKYFRYTGFGEIIASDNDTMMDAAKATIDNLGLNQPILQTSRRKEIQKILPLIDGCSSEEIQLLIKGYQEFDSNGQLTPFCAAIIYILKIYFEETEI